MNFKNVDKKYRPIPFWSWNEKLETEETSRQIRMMDKAGIGGFFMHARGGLQTEYLGEEWFDNVKASIDTAKETGMRPWAYDENGWPSGFGAGVVNGMGVEYQQKYLRMEDVLEHRDTHICEADGKYFYYDINPFYVDTLDKKVIAEFIKVAYEPYYERYGTEFEGFFTDEPQISRNGIPWSFVFEDEYKARYNDDLYPHLAELFLPKGDYKTTRVRFWKMVTDLFSSAFMKQIYDWCNEHGLKLTGHLVIEESLLGQLVTNGACMPHYEYFHIPGMDWLGRDVRECLTPMQVSSVAEQLGHEAVLSETFACCGHNVSFAELKGIYEWQMVHGINLLCQHLEGYSNRGIRKRDYPPAMYYQQPWWEDYDKFNDAMSRIGMVLTKGKKKVDVLLLHPQTTAWILYDGGENKGIDELDKKLLGVMKTLEEKHIPYHLGDETIMERHAKVEKGKLVIGNQVYSYVIDPECEVLLDTTKELLDEYRAQGGKFTTADELPANNVVDSEKLTYKTVEYDTYKAHYFVNTSAERFSASFAVQGKVMDMYTGDLSAFCGTHEFEPWGSLMIIEDGSENVQAKPEEATVIRPEGEYKIVGELENSMTLDRCDYYFDGELQEKNGYVLNVCERANKLGRKVAIHQDYHVTFNHIPSTLYMACETPWIFDITVNGAGVEYADCGYFRDASFRKIDIAKYVKLGENTISFDVDFVQSDDFYKNLKKSYIFESEKNKLVYDMEIEAIYLVGNFAVGTPGKWAKLDYSNKANRLNEFAERYSGEFTVEKPAGKVNVKCIHREGFPFFSGKLNLEGEIEVKGKSPVLELDMHGINSLHVKIDSREFVAMTDNIIPLNGVSQGKHKVEFTLINNLRNLLGPHHIKNGEELSTGPGKFFKEPCVWNRNPEPDWDDNYCFVEMKI